MRIRSLFVPLVITLVLPAAVFAQLGPEAPILAHQTLTPFGLDAPDAVETGLFTYNPAAAVGIKDYGIRNLLEFDIGRIDFSDGPSVDSHIQTYWGSSGNNYFKIARYDYESNIALMPRILPPGVGAEFSGESWALTYAREDSNIRWGVTWFPENESETRLHVDTPMGWQQIAFGEAETDFAGRVGFQIPVSKTLTFGATYHYEESDTLFIPPPPLGPSDVMTGSYETEVAVLGLAWRPMLGTTVSVDYENGSIKGDNLDESINIWYIGAEQFLSPQFSVKVSNLDDAFGLGLNYYHGTDYILGFSFAPSGFRRTGEFLGNVLRLVRHHLVRSTRCSFIVAQGTGRHARGRTTRRGRVGTQVRRKRNQQTHGRGGTQCPSFVAHGAGRYAIGPRTRRGE